MLEELLFGDITETPQDILSQYKAREEGKNVTRIAPSPTGFLHIGAIYSTLVDKIVASRNDGILFLRIEDTDQKREVEGASKKYVDILKKFGLNFQEGPIGENYQDVGNYGPYTQSKREYIYKIFIKDWVKKGLAYPCFMSEEEIDSVRAIQEASKVPTGIYGEFSSWRNASLQQVQEALAQGKKFVIRFKSPGEITKKIQVSDLIKGDIVIGENFNDIVIMKTDGIPTYHFAHLIDDHLMGTTHVIRGDEWFASLPLHTQLFKVMGWTPPKYAHYGPLVKIEGESKRKLSKRKDPEADVEYYFREGFLVEGIIDFLCNLINAGFEEWRAQNPTSSYLEYDFKLERMSSSGALVDLVKLAFVNSKMINTLSLDEMYEKISLYLQEYHNEFFTQKFQSAPKEYNQKILKELQQRLSTWGEFIALTSFFYDDFEVTQRSLDLLVNPKMKIDSQDVAKQGLELAYSVISQFEENITPEEIKNTFIDAIKEKEMKNGQVLWPVRVALSGEEFSPGALELIFILGREKSLQRIQKVLDLL